MELDQKKLDEIKKLFADKTRKDCYAIDFIDDAPSILDDKLGGKPYLPIGEENPKDKKGRPLPLLLQVNLKNIDLPNFPKKGILEIFTDTNWPLNYKVKLFKEGLEYQTELPDAKCYYTAFNGNEEETEFFVYKPQKIKLRKSVCYLPLSNYEFYDVFDEIVARVLDLDLDQVNLEDYFGGWENLYDLRSDVASSVNFDSCTIGGYPDYTQDDIRDEFDHPMEICLFKLDCVGNDCFDIGDSGIICGYISTEDLKAGNFDNVYIDFDCC